MAKKKAGKKKSGMQRDKAKEPVRKGLDIKKIVLRAALFIALALILLILFRSDNPNNDAGETVNGANIGEKPNPVATLEMESGGLIKIELDPANAPNTVKNFIELAEAGFYDGLTFHRVIPDFMIQGGCPEGTGQGGPGYSITGEFAENGHTNELLHKRGVISMARGRLPDTAGSQFFITVAEKPHLDEEYAAFGTVLEGMDEVDRIVAVPTDQADKPLEEVRIRQIRVELFGVDYGPPEKL